MPVHKVRQIFMMQKVDKYDNVINRAFRMVGIAVASILLESNHYQITATYLNIAYQ